MCEYPNDNGEQIFILARIYLYYTYVYVQEYMCIFDTL